MVKALSALLIGALLVGCAGMKINTRDGAGRAEPGADPFPRDKTR